MSLLATEIQVADHTLVFGLHVPHNGTPMLLLEHDKDHASVFLRIELTLVAAATEMYLWGTVVVPYNRSLGGRLCLFEFCRRILKFVWQGQTKKFDQ